MSKAKPKDEKQLVSVDAGALIAAGLMDESMIGAGQADHIDDYALPFLAILQANSPQVTRGQAEYIAGAESSMIFNTVTGEFFDGMDKGVEVIRVSYEKTYIEWRDREQGGGFVRVVDVNTGRQLEAQCDERTKGGVHLANGNLLRPTAQHYVMLVHKDGSLESAIISMSSTQLKKARVWNSLISNVRMGVHGRDVQAPSFASRWLLKTIPESNNEGNWFGWDIVKKPLGFVTPEQFKAAKEFYEAVKRGEAKAKEPTHDQDMGGAKTASEVM